ncbi:MAG: hypothetical protein ACYTF6_04155 [Planctomycetota bacterium]|jgi:hypothetical protein
MRKRPVNLAGITFSALAVGAILAGCGSGWQNYTEKFVRSGICEPGGEDIPGWVQGPLPSNGDEVYFVGRGIGHNVLDERGAYNAAADHVVEQLAKHVATWVSLQAAESDLRSFAPGSGWPLVPGPWWGNRFQPGERSRQNVEAAVGICTEALVGDLVPRDVYWEQWYVEEMPERPFPNSLRMKRYKCWVLMSISRKAVETRVAATLEALKTAAAGPSTFFASVGTHGPPEARRLDAAGASQLFRVTSPKAKRVTRTGRSYPPPWNYALDIPEKKD